MSFVQILILRHSLVRFAGKTVQYETLEKFMLEYTMLKDSQIIQYVIKPLIADEKIIKHNITNKRNYKQDRYTVK